MRRITVPDVSFHDTISACLEGVGSQEKVAIYTGNLFLCDAVEKDYAERAQQGQLFTFQIVDNNRGRDPIVHGELLKSDLTSLYTQYLVPDGKPGRLIYERLKVTANGKCPLCGDIGHVKTLDHYLPKANYPLFSVLPGNLVPCCRDCNSEKRSIFAETVGEQTLHPYFDDDKYFYKRWVFADVIETAPPSLRFYVDPPDDWLPEERDRVLAHFVRYSLGEKFGTEASSDLSETIQTRQTTLRDASSAEFSGYLLDKSATLDFPVSNWRRVMFASLAASDWFCSNHFG